MTWLSDRIEWRENPKILWPEAKSVIMLAQSYAPVHNPMDVLKYPNKAAISVYAQNKDYHVVIKKKLKSLARWLIEAAGGEVKVFVDTAPVPEKPLGQMAGLGWQGKHTNLVSRDLGNWFFIGSIFTTVEIEPDDPEVDHCGSCQSCIDICPTDAFPKPYQIDARRCISYLTIEHRGPVEIDLRSKIGNRIYGCDDCLAVCPWNKFAKAGSETRLYAREELKMPDLKELVSLDDRAFRDKFSGSPIKRIGRDRFVRNVLYAIGNSRKQKFKKVVTPLTKDPDFAIRDAATWALTQLA
jgi:epoxyqueuosine reductase|tara:strand:- start:397 stop:1287 length:891 start_codon:yes stop_codon:yes gene_type:complete